MDSELLKILSDGLRETKMLVIETRRMADETRSMAIDARRKADAAWELVVITRNQVKEELHYLKLPWWKKLSGKAA